MPAHLAFNLGERRSELFIHFDSVLSLKGKVLSEGILSDYLRDEEETNVPILRRIWIRFQGASMGAY
jgi:hypothetical protein